MAKRRRQGKGKAMKKESPNNSKSVTGDNTDGIPAVDDPQTTKESAEPAISESSNGNIASLKRRQTTLTTPSTSTQENDTNKPPVKRMRSRISTQSSIIANVEDVPNVKRMASSRVRPSSDKEQDRVSLAESKQSTPITKEREEGAANTLLRKTRTSTLNQQDEETHHVHPDLSNDIKPSTSAQKTEVPSLKRNDTMIMEPSTSGSTTYIAKLPSINTESGPVIATPVELMRIASLRKNLSKKESFTFLQGSATSLPLTHANITEPSSSDPETRALIAKSMEMMRRASLRRGSSQSEEEEDELPTKKKKVPTATLR